MGRPSVFSEKLALRILELAKSGKTDAQIAKAVGIALSTLKLWKADRADFSAALKDAKDIADSMVEAALFQRAVGYRHPAVKFFCDKGIVVSQRYTEVYAPDVTACIFWLKNRQPDRWRDVHKHEVAGDGGEPIQLAYVPKSKRAG